ncbi:PP2C family protein-serine/threonine phosphatase [Streptomyces sp. ODS28]|uniref:PP2C family protein-serine/threonine phosphatase n=1 Tax=Streptomyces sp. ODS28 TaxID=3136688 RepID=UPI0031E9BDCE
MGTGRAVRAQNTAVWPQTWVRWLPPLFIVIAVALEVTVPPRYFFGSLLSASVLLGALVYPPLGTLATGFACALMLVILDISATKEYNEHLSGAMITVCIVTVLVTLLSVARVRAARQLSQVRAVAQAAQLALLRPLPEHIGPVRMAGCYQAATDEALIGGDLYGVRRSPYGLRVLIGDVRGKGIGATGTVATILASFREAATVCTDLPEVADRIEAALALDREDAEAGMLPSTAPPPEDPVRAARKGSQGRPQGAPAVPEPPQSAGELFATAVLMELPEDEEVVRVLARGHPPLFRLGPDEVTPLEPLEEEYGLPLGLGELATGPQRVRRFELPAGRMLVAYSDGVTEARDRDGEFYPLRQRLAAHFTSTDTGTGSGSGPSPGPAADWDAEPPLAPSDVVSFVQRDVNRWAPSLNDDLVVVVLKRCATPEGQHPQSAGPDT